MPKLNDGGALRIGFVGLGNQGAPIAHRIQAGGHPFRGYDLRESAVEPFLDAGAERVKGPADLAENSDVVMICVGTTREVAAIYPELIAHMSPGATLVVHSSAHPDLVRQIGVEAQALDIAVLDAPVSGGAKGAEDGTLTVLVGGDESTFEKVLPIFELYGSPVKRVGPLGSGVVLKAFNNYLAQAQKDILDQTITALVGLGFNPRDALEVLVESVGGTRKMQWLLDHWEQRPDGTVIVHTGGRSGVNGTRSLEMDDEVMGIARDVLQRAGVLQPVLDDLVTRGIELAHRDVAEALTSGRQKS
jgi:3-hydroxyisobutyrate dehydrogenase